MTSQLALRIAGPVVLLSALAACTSGGSGTPTSSSPVAPSTSGSRTTSSSAPHPTSTRPTGPSSGPATGTAPLVRKADAVCATGNAYRRAHPFPFPKFDPSDPKVQDLPAVATYLKKAPDVAGRLLRLDLPLGAATALTQEQKNVNAQISAAATSDPQTFAHAAQDAKSVTQRLRAAFAPAGLSTAKACLTYFAA